VAVQTKQDVLAVLLERKEEMRQLGVRRVGLFGSFVCEESDDQSDVDLLVEFEPGQKTFDHFITLSFLLEEWVQRRVELVTPEGLSPYIGPHIVQKVEYVTPGA